MDTNLLEQTYVAQVLALAGTLEVLNKLNSKSTNVDYEKEAIKIINRRSSRILQLLDESRQTN